MPDRVTSSRCVPADQRIDLLVNAVTNLINAGGTTYTAGDGIDATQLASGIIQTSIDGVSIIFDGGVMKAVAASDLVAGCGITIAGGEASAAVDGTTIDCVGGNLTVIAFAFGTIHVSGQDDVVATTPADDWTLAGAGATAITTNAGTKVVTITSTDTNTTYTAGAGINLSSTKFIADPNTASHVGLVDPATGNDSSGDDAQIGVLWHNIQDYAVGRNMLLGHLEDDSTKPVVQYKTTEDWMELLEGYDNTKSQVICNDPAQTGNEDSERVRWVDSPQKVIWGLDPDGGHTITTSGTTMTLTLKVTKYTFDAVNFVSAVDQDVTVTYTGTECA